MRSTMQSFPLLVSDLLKHAGRYHGLTEVVSRAFDTDSSIVLRSNWGEVAEGAAQLANAFNRLGLPSGSCVGTLANNHLFHLHAYFAVPGSGRVLHTINPRMGIRKIAFAINAANDSAILFDRQYRDLVQQLESLCPGVALWICMSEESQGEKPDGQYVDYRQLVSGEAREYRWPVLPEDAPASICFTSGTTGDPKGVVYSHRSVLIHSMMLNHVDVFGLSAVDSVLPIVPMYHVNAWGLPYAAAMSGARVVLPGDDLSGEALFTLIVEEKVTIAAAVPIVLQRLLEVMGDQSPAPLSRCLVGGTACPHTLMTAFRERGVRIIKSWGMTELSPIGAVDAPLNPHGRDRASSTVAAAGRPPFGISLDILDEQQTSVSWDDSSVGELVARGHWVTGCYLDAEMSAGNDDWFHTGDVASLDADGYVTIRDRKKDMIKSGGEWISSLELEHIANQHEGVRLSAAVGVPCNRWGERPVVVLELHSGMTVTADELYRVFAAAGPKWTIPDRFYRIDTLPLTQTGKIEKRLVRDWMSAGNSAISLLK